MLIHMNDSSRACFVAEEVDAIRLPLDHAHKLYVMAGNCSSVCSFKLPADRDQAFKRLLEKLPSPLIIHDNAQTAVNCDAVVGFRRSLKERELVLLLPSWSLLCQFTTEQQMVEAEERLQHALEGGD